MGFKYTGRASEFRIPGDEKVYKPGDIIPISREDALHMSEQSNLHSFEIVKSGDDLMENATKPEPISTATPISVAKPDEQKDEDGKKASNK